MLEALTEAQLDTITGGTNDERLPPLHAGRAVSAPVGLGTHVKPIGQAMTQKKLPIYSTGSAS